MKYAIKDIVSQVTKEVVGFLPLIISLLFLLCKQYELDLINWSVLAIGMILIGIPHGAMDHVLTHNHRSASSLARFILRYLAMGLAMFAIWVFSPILGLIIFLFYSMWHFGQAEFEQEDIQKAGLIFLRGFAVLSFILATHIPETNAIINALSIPTISDVHGIFTGSLFFESTLLLLLISSLLTPRFTIILGTLSLIIGMKLQLLQAFGVYFIFHHSFMGWNHLKKGLDKTDSQLWKAAAPFSLGAFGILSLLFISENIAMHEFAPLFFVFLSCLSFPHVVEMHGFYSSMFKYKKA